MTDDLAGFMLARIAEDEEVARGAAGVPWETMRWPGGSQVLVAASAIRNEKWRLGKLGHVATVEHTHDVDHIARHDPARVLAECDAKRRIVEQYIDAVKGRKWATCTALERVLPVLALPYADHPDYREEWRP